MADPVAGGVSPRTGMKLELHILPPLVHLVPDDVEVVVEQDFQGNAEGGREPEGVSEGGEDETALPLRHLDGIPVAHQLGELLHEEVPPAAPDADPGGVGEVLRGEGTERETGFLRVGIASCKLV